MWDPKLEAASTQQVDSGFLSSDQILDSFTEEEQHQQFGKQQQPQAPQVDFKSGSANLDAKLQPVEPTLDSGLVEDFATSSSDNMLLEKDVDTGLAEWLCRSMNLEKSQAGSINNLSSSRRPLTQQQENNISSGSSSNHNISPTITLDQRNISEGKVQESSPLEMPEEEQPWERCYKQDADGETYLHLAVYDGEEDIVRSLIQITPHPCLLDIQNDLLQSSLHLAVITGNVRIVRMLLLAGAESSTRDRYGNTPLHLACAAGDLEAVKALTERITATEEASMVSCTGVLVAGKQGAEAQPLLNRLQLVQYADVELRNYDGERCVHIAASVTPTEKSKHVEVMRQLVCRSGADVNAREGKAGYTALHMAVERGDVELVKFLLSECPSLNLEVCSYGRWTAYQIAMVNRNEELMAMLQSKGAEALDVSSSSDESDDDDSDLDGDEILRMLSNAASTSSSSGGHSYHYQHDRTVPCAGY